MVSRSPDDGDFQSPKPAPKFNSLPESNPGTYEVIVPVFLKVTLHAEDDLAAECHAVERVRKLGKLSLGSGVTIVVHSVIAPQPVRPTPA